MFMFNKTKNRLNKYKDLKFTVKPDNKLSTYLPTLISPLYGAIFNNVLSLIFTIYLVISNPVFLNIDGFTKGKQIAYLTFSLGGFYFLTSYLITWLIILPISKILKHKNGSTFWGLSANIIFIIAMAIFFALNKNVMSAKYYFIPILFLTNGLINIFAFKTMNEIYARDENGKIIFNEETEVDKSNTNKIKK